MMELYLPSAIGRELTGRPNKFTQWLVDNKILYRKGRALRAKLRYENCGYLTYETTGDDSASYEQVYFTDLGKQWITRIYEEKNND